MKNNSLSLFLIAALSFHSNYGAMSDEGAATSCAELRQSATTMRTLAERAKEILNKMQRLIDAEQEKINTPNKDDTQ